MQDKMDYFIERSDKRFDKIESKLDSLIEFRWRLVGGAAAVTTVISIVIGLISLVMAQWGK